MTGITLLGLGSSIGAAAAANFGYFSGGYTGANVATTDRLDFAADTTTQVTKGALSAARRQLSGYNSATIGYVSSGFEAARVTGSDGLTFSTDTTTMVTKGVLTVASNNTGSTNSSTIGYTTGMDTGATPFGTTSNGLTFSTDTTAQVTKGALNVAMSLTQGANSSTIGYWAGGTTGTYGGELSTTEDDALTFSTDTTTMVTKGALVLARHYAVAYNSSTLAYYSGGRTSGGAASTTTCNSLTFSTDTTGMVTKGALTGAFDSQGAVNSSDLGYGAGGQTNNDGTYISTNNGLTFSTDTTAQVTKGVLSQARGFLAGFQGGSGTQLI